MTVEVICEECEYEADEEVMSLPLVECPECGEHALVPKKPDNGGEEEI